MNLFRTKCIEQMRETAAHSGMAKTLGAFDLILLGIGCVIGTHAGPGAFGLAFLDEGFTF